MGKGSGRRPAAIDEQTVAANWARAFAGELPLPAGAEEEQQSGGQILVDYDEWLRLQRMKAELEAGPGTGGSKNRTLTDLYTDTTVHLSNGSPGGAP